MSHLEREDLKLHQLKIRVQNLKVLLEEAVLRGDQHRMKQLLSDIAEAEDAIVTEREKENDQTSQAST